MGCAIHLPILYSSLVVGPCQDTVIQDNVIQVTHIPAASTCYRGGGGGGGGGAYVRTGHYS